MRHAEELGAYWFEEPIAPEDLDGYRELLTGLRVNISGGEAEFNRWGWRRILESRGLDIAQPEVCALGGISEYLRVLALCHAHFTPVINHVWGSAIAVATNLQLLAAMPALPGGLYPWEPMLEFDTTENRFRDDLLTEPLDIQGQVGRNHGRVAIRRASASASRRTRTSSDITRSARADDGRADRVSRSAVSRRIWPRAKPN